MKNYKITVLECSWGYLLSIFVCGLLVFFTESLIPMIVFFFIPEIEISRSSKNTDLQDQKHLLSEEEFCRIHSGFDGEPADKIGQISLETFTGEELKEYVEHHLQDYINKADKSR